MILFIWVIITNKYTFFYKKTVFYLGLDFLSKCCKRKLNFFTVLPKINKHTRFWLFWEISVFFFWFEAGDFLSFFLAFWPFWASFSYKRFSYKKNVSKWNPGWSPPWGVDTVRFIHCTMWVIHLFTRKYILLYIIAGCLIGNAPGN